MDEDKFFALKSMIKFQISLCLCCKHWQATQPKLNHVVLLICSNVPKTHRPW